MRFFTFVVWKVKVGMNYLVVRQKDVVSYAVFGVMHSI